MRNRAAARRPQAISPADCCLAAGECPPSPPEVADSNESATFYFALLLLGTQKHRQKPGRRCPFSPKFSPTGTLTGRLLNLLKILLFVETAVSLHPLEYVTSAADTISVPNGGRECKDVTPEPCCRVRIR